MSVFQRVMIRTAALMALGVLTACTVVVDEPGGRPYPRPDPSTPQMCTMEYNPVCGERGNNRRTFGNACQARAEGYRITDRGECRPQRPDRPDYGGDRPQICTREYAPVCARQGRREQTFSNSCMAEAQGFRVIGRGECERGDDRPGDGSGMRPPREPQICTNEYAPVCARQGRREQTFPNSCTAQAQGFRIIGNGECR